MKLKTFTHKSFLDPDWVAGPGQKYADAPKARMRVVRATTKTVWYGYASETGVGGFRMDRETFEERYGSPYEQGLG